MPEQDAVVVIRSGVKDMQAVLNLVWDKLLAGMTTKLLPADNEADTKLQTKLAGLALPTQKGNAAARIPKEVSGKMYSFSPNEQKVELLGLEFGSQADPVTLVGKFNGGAEQRIVCGNGEWNKVRLSFCPLPEQPAAVCGAWTADDIYTAKISLYETPYLITIVLNFSKDQLRVDSAWNVSFGPTEKGQLIGELK